MHDKRGHRAIRHAQPPAKKDTDRPSLAPALSLRAGSSGAFLRARPTPPEEGNFAMTFASWLRARTGSPASTRKPARARWRPSLGALEDRVVPSATVSSRTTFTDANNDGKADSISSSTSKYDNHHNLLS